MLDSTTLPAPPPEKPPSLYAKRVRVYPKAVSGVMRRIKWGILAACLLIYYLVPLIRWDRGPGRPSQAVLLDMWNERFYIFSVELWPQDIWLLSAALIAATVALFLVTSIMGRVWCGYACPQTIWTDLFMLVERRIEGDRNTRLKRDAGPLTFDKAWRKVAKHAAWVAIGFATGGALTMYFVDVPTLVREFWTGTASSTVYLTIALLTAGTYFMAGWTREQWCTYMCPWPRFQSAMSDEETLSVTYRVWRGEPRGKGKAQREALGDCVDCGSCVHVCPVGIDIRDGLQPDCINCGLCIDACNHVMTRTGRQPWLISWDSFATTEARAQGKQPKPIRLQRTRTIVYGAALVGLAGIIVGGLVLRPRLTLLAEHDRLPLFVALRDGSVRNAYTMRIANKIAGAGQVRLTVTGLKGAVLSAEGQHADRAGGLVLPVPTDGNAEYRIFITARNPASAGTATRPLEFHIRRLSDGAEAEAHENFISGMHP
ncbi:MAG: cytochrome c oxidase accessory protein CcoG [Rhodospirillales bacterium]|nr:cytochrome c oxidase accessory protein CcoG [Rhodospirillales bacterium]